MSYLFRPTPVMNPWGPAPKPFLPAGLRGGAMRGYQVNVNWQELFESARRVPDRTPWIVKSGTMGRFGMGQDAGDIDSDVGLPLAPVDTSNINLDLGDTLPPGFFNISAPNAPAIVPYNPGSVASAPSVTSGGGTASLPGSNLPALPGVSSPSSSGISSIVSSLSTLATSITKAATGINPAVAPVAPINTAGMTATQQSLVAQAQQLQAQAAAATAAGNPSLAATYTAEANQLLAEAQTSSANFFTESTLISGMPNYLTLGLGVAFLAIAAGAIGKISK